MNIKVTKTEIIIDEDYVLNDKEYNVNQCNFTFSEEYTNDLVKKAIFVQDSKRVEQPIINNKCSIPAEVLNKGVFELRVYAYEIVNNKLELRYSPSYATAYVRTGSYIENAEAPEVVTPTQFQQYMQAMNDGLNEVANVDIDAEQLDNGMSVTITNRYGEDKTVYAYDGEKGETGATPNIQIGTVVTGDHSEVTRTGTNENPIFNFVLEKGDKGDTGNGIASVTKTSTSGLVDTYTITYTNGTTTTFDVTNGKSISNIAKTSTSGLEDTYTITYNDNTTSTFTVTNGNGISSIEKTGTQDNVDTYTIYYTNGTTSTFTVTNSTVTNQEFEKLKAEHEELVNTLPRVEGTGESITLDNTAQYKMNVALSGNTSQTTYIGKNLLDYNLTKLQNNNTAGTWNNNVYTFNGVTFTYNEDGSITARGEASSSFSFYINRNNKDFTTLSAGTYYFTSHEETGANDTWKQNIGTNFSIYGSGSNKEVSRTLSEDTNVQVSIYIYSGYNPNGATFYPMISTTSGGEYEPYVGGVPSPNPLYPQPIKKVTGDNTITVCGKNLWGGFNSYDNSAGGVSFHTNEDGSVLANGTATTSATSISVANAISNGIYVTLKAGTYVVSCPEVTNPNQQVQIYDENSTSYGQMSGTPKTITLTQTTKIILRIRIVSGETVNNKTFHIQLEHGSVASEYEQYQGQTYPINLGSLEYCEIGNYSDKFALSTGKNLFDKDNINKLNAQLSDGQTIASSSNAKTFYIPITGGNTYTVSRIAGKRFRVGTTTTIPTIGDTVSNFIKSDASTSITVTTDINANYLCVYYFLNGTDTLTEQEILNSIMVNEGSTALPWEPYGIGNFYLLKNIGKYVYNDDLTQNAIGETRVGMLTPTLNIQANLSGAALGNRSLCNILTTTISDNTGCNGTTSGSKIRIYMSSDYVTTYEEMRTLCAEKNLTIYYGVETPTSEPITDTTLIEQLNNLYNQIKSYKGQTNITQTNAELPFNIDASALYDLNNLISRVATLETEV